MKRRRAGDALTALAARSFPPERRADARVVRDCAREAIDASGARALPRELPALVAAGLRARMGLAARDLWRAPWRSALSALTLPLAAAILLVWTSGFVPRYDHWPLGEGWALLLGGSLVAVVGAAFRSRWIAATGAAATFVAAASPYLGFGTEDAMADTASFYQGSALDLGAASLLPTLLLLAGALALPNRPRRARRLGVGRAALGMLPAAVALVFLLPAPEPRPTLGVKLHGPGLEPTLHVGPPDSMPWIGPSQDLLLVLGVALAAAILVTWLQARTDPAAALASGLVLVSVAYPLAWVSVRNEPAPYWAYDAGFVGVMAAMPLLVALALMRRAGRMRRRLSA